MEETIEFSIKDILGIIKNNLVFILIISLSFSIGSFFITKFFIQKTYTSSVKLYVETTYDNSSASDNLNLYNYAEKLVATYLQMLDTNSFYTSVSKQLNGEYDSTELNEMISFTAVEDTEVFEADVVALSPEEAKDIADAIAIIAPRTISKLNDNAQLKIVDPAVLPEEPTSPSLIKNVLLALVIGLVLSFIIAFIRDYFDVKVKYDEEMTTLCDVPVLAAIPDFEFYTNNQKNSKNKAGASASTRY